MSESPTQKIRAGEAFAELLKTDPATRAAWERVSLKFRILSAIVESPDFQELRTNQRNAARRLLQEVRAELKADKSNSRLLEYEISPPETLEDWIEVGRIAEMPESELSKATAGEIFDRTIAWAKRQTIRARLVSRATAAQDPNTTEPPKRASKKGVVKAKRSTQRGDGEAKLIAALTKHHEYADGGCLNSEPVGSNQLARLAEVAKRTASAFFSKKFQGYAKYRALCNDPPRLVAALKALNGEFRPSDFYDARTPGEMERDDD